MVVFTSEVDDDFRPVDRLDSTHLAAGSVSLYLRWFDLGVGRERRYRCEVRDGGGELVSVSETVLDPKSSTWESRTRYRFNPAIDRPGTWSFRAFIDGELRVDAPLEVRAE